MMHFENISRFDRQGKGVIQLKSLHSEVNIESIIIFLTELVPHIINHRNQLRLYRNTLSEVTGMFDKVSIDIDYFEILSVPVKQGPQSFYWRHQHVTVHFGIPKVQGDKSYHRYLSNYRIYDQIFVNIAMHEMLMEIIEEIVCDGTALTGLTIVQARTNQLRTLHTCSGPQMNEVW